MEQNYATPKRNGHWGRNQFAIQLIVIFGLQMHADMLFKGFFVHCQVVRPNEAKSSPRNVVALRGESVWLHWEYIYVGDGMQGGVVTTKYIRQVIGFTSASNSTFHLLAQRISQKGVLQLEPSIPMPFKGRVEMISSNFTLAIHGLQYNDSLYRLSSAVTVTIDPGNGPILNKFDLKPVVRITVNGIPKFRTHPPSSLELTEDSTLFLRIDMDGHPQPSADFKWTHFPTSTTVNVPSVQLYPFVYSSTYSLNNIDGRYCGKILRTTIRNRIGSAPLVKYTNVTVLLNLNHTLNLNATKTLKTQCIEINWHKHESGACFVRYDVQFQNSSGIDLHNMTVYNIGEIKICNLTTFFNITYINLIVSFNDARVSSSVRVFAERTLPPTLQPRIIKEISDSNLLFIIGTAFGGLVSLVVIIILLLHFIKKIRRAWPNQRSRTTSSFHQDKQRLQRAMLKESRMQYNNESTHPKENGRPSFSDS